ncbi:hypothetical protein Moror_1470 [Moniliophthora roreri MCA 2997]|uniref:Uncharacterized protein n=1 Tax=Moniliophthora roreri (strain MCA 2997) TaxID=1381753 RepID=V2X3G5_MONRO|nr:hypothetical protein Moror_1470 [Moniliophthora roreri MCA 2997]
MSSTLSHFGCLDELIQIIYQNVNRFVLISSVNDEQWTIKMGLTGSEGRWWSGSWSEGDILAIIGSRPSATLLEKFAQKLADSIIQGEIFVSNWDPSPGAEIKLTLAPGSKKPMHVPLTEISTAEAACFAANLFSVIALQAQSRKCQLHGTSIPSGASLSFVSTNAPSASSKSELPKVRTTLNSKRKEPSPSPEFEPESRGHPASRPMKGASLANPNKKARKYQAIEFGSDED